MKIPIKRLIINILYKLGYFNGLHSLQRDIYKILCYHRFVPDDSESSVSKKYLKVSELEKQLNFIAERFDIKSLEQCIKDFKQNGQWGENTLSITIDDGYQDFYRYAYPIFKKKKIPATVFLIYDFIENQNWLWQDKIKYALRKSTKSRLINDPIFGTLLFYDYQQTLQCQLSLYYQFAELSPMRRKHLINLLLDKLNVQLPDNPPSDFTSLNWMQIKEMAENGISFGAHTVNHEVLTTLNDQELEFEIQESKLRIEERLGSIIYTFCYPHGRADRRVIRAAKQAGFAGAVHKKGANNLHSELFSLDRLFIEEQPMHLFVNSIYRY